MGMRVVGIACVTSMAPGVCESKLSNTEMNEVSSYVRTSFKTLMKSSMPEF